MAGTHDPRHAPPVREAGADRFELAGIGVGRGIAIGRAHRLAPSELEVAHYNIERRDVVHEIGRLSAAFERVRRELLDLRADIAGDAPSEAVGFLDLHRMILDDTLLSQAPRDLIRTRMINAEWALSIQLEEVVRQFEAIDDDYLRERSADVRQVVERVLKALAGAQPAVADVPAPGGADERLIVVAYDLAPADMLHLKRRADITLGGFVTELGGPTSHTAILARALGLPAVVGAEGAFERIGEGTQVVLDGEAGHLVVDPRADELDDFRRRLRQQQEHRQALRKLRGKLSRTRDGIALELLANIELPEDAQLALDVGADGIGLFRSEFLFMNRDRLPGEDEQFEAYARVARAMKGKPVVIRTLDVGADKVFSEAAGAAHERHVQANPALGLRAIRYCLAYPELFLTQLRAILRASALGTVRVLVPMLAHVHEIEQALAYVQRAKEQLRDARQKYDGRVQVGGMIEVPAAALSVPQFVKRLKFLSIGTNDLIQYTLAIDRSDASVAHLYDHMHPAVLKLIAQTIRTGARSRVPVAVCGELAGEPAMTELLLGMGLRQFSMHAAQILPIKEALLDLSAREATRLAASVLRQTDPMKVRRALERRVAA